MSDRLAERSRRIARERYWKKHDKDSYNCPDCGRGEDEIVGVFQVHHKSGTPHDNRLGHLVALCGFCHRLREGKKPSLRRITQFKNASNKTGSPQLPSLVERFIDRRVCLCSEGRNYGWVEPIQLWFDTFEAFGGYENGELDDASKTMLLDALRAAPETTIEWEGKTGAMPVVVGPDPNGKRNCHCLTRADLSWSNRGGRR